MPDAVDALFRRQRLTLIAGPCVIENAELCLQVADYLQALSATRNLPVIFKASFDKANRTSVDSFRGPGLEAGLEVLRRVKKTSGLPVLTDVHEPAQVAQVAQIVDVIQIPAFLCRQTDLVVAAARADVATNIKKGQFVAPEDMAHVAHKYRAAGGTRLSVTERGATFGYHDLVVDMRSLVRLREATGAAIVFDATHSVQRPGLAGASTGGDRTMAPVLARAATAVGIDGLFCEVHPDPDRALSDGPNSLDFDTLERTLDEVLAIDQAIRAVGGTTGEAPHDR